ncbi:colicin V production protein [Natranaerovirga hydrolytica]|uniref:Colicin V production protein n=1 Tax=Natranaerovirga hydrolytica TaxID=680378 RepID=A0A4V2PYP6_9FIRM|nr:CvpA family protein [Natranaerovirga hydrolytica]TCK86721.1 colicin V production protein [Natranaerovirga hydrolytica]
MNWLDIIIIGIIVFCTLRAYRRGFILSLFSLVSLLLTILLTVQLYPVGSRLISQHTNIYESFQSSISNTLNLEEQLSGSQTLEEQTSLINNLPLPSTIRESLLVNNNREVYDILQVNRLEDYISGYIARIAINILSFIIIFLIVYIGLRILIRTLDIISKLPVLNSVNKLLGIGFGLILGLIKVWFVFIIITFFSTNGLVMIVFEKINESSFASALYNNNVLLKIILDLSKNIL